MTLPNLVLISSVRPQTVTSGGIILYRLLATYPPDKLLVMGPAPDPGAKTLACRYEPLNPPLDAILNSRIGSRLARTRLSRVKEWLNASGCLPGISNRAITDRLRDFRPSAVLSVFEGDYYRFAYRFAEARRLPLALIVHDESVLFEMSSPRLRRLRIRQDGEVYRFAAARFCISAEMEESLCARYGVKGEVMHPVRSGDVTRRDPSQAETLKTPGKLRIGYAGTLGYGYGEQLGRMIPAFREAKVELRLYAKFSWDADRYFGAANDAVTPRGLAGTPEETWERIKDECDAVILPYASGNPDQEQLYRTHFASKLTEYTSLGMPIVVVGKPAFTGVRWALQHPGAALVLDGDDRRGWVEALETLSASPDLRRALGSAAFDAGQRDFDPGTIRQTFLGRISSIATAAHG